MGRRLTILATVTCFGIVLTGCAGTAASAPAEVTITAAPVEAPEMTDIEFFEYMKRHDSLLAMKNVEFVAEMAQVVCKDVPASVKLVELANSPEFDGDSSETVVYARLMTKMLAPSVRNYCPESIEEVPDLHR